MAEITYNDLIPGTDIYAPTLIANVVNKSGWTVSCNMFKSKSILDPNPKAPFSAYVRGNLEAANGAHYYARSFDTSTYQSVSCTVPLWKCSMSDPKGRRAGNISLGICTENAKPYHHFDVGLRNLRGEGWHPMIWAKICRGLESCWSYH